jgi:hypothetical protein
LPGMAPVSAEFDRSCDEDEYERKIGALVGAIHARNDVSDGSANEAWDAAVAKLSGEDHYLLVLIGAARSGWPGTETPRKDWVRLGLILAGVAAGLIALWTVVQDL